MPATKSDATGSRERDRTPRRRRPLDFRLRFTQMTALKNFFENLSSVFKEVELKVKSDVAQDGFCGIEADSIDAHHVALLKGRMMAEVEMNVDSASFCIDVQKMNQGLSNAHPHHCLDIYRFQGSTDIEVVIYEPGVSWNTTFFTVKTLAKDNETMEIDDMGYDYYLEVDANEVKNALKLAKLQKAERIQMRICRRKSVSYHTMWFMISYSTPANDVCGRKLFKSHVRVSDKEGATTVVVVDAGETEVSGEEAPHADEEDELEVLYHATFSAEYLNNFVKAMERNNITMRLANNKPLILDYPLGDSHNHLRYVLAPHCED